MTVMLHVMGLTLTAFGVGFLLIAAVGVWRFPDVMSRLHALTKADTAGLALIAMGAACLTGRLDTLPALGLCVLLVALSGVTIGHLIASAHLSEAELE